MSEASERLEGFLAERREGPVADRLAELDDLADAAAAATEEDLPVLSALAGDTRYRLARALVEADDELCVCELQGLSPVGESAVSHALADLADAGLVSARDDGRWRYYRATDRAAVLLAALDEARDAGAEGGT